MLQPTMVKIAWRACALAVLTLATGCVTVAEHRKLERRVTDVERGGAAPGGGGGTRERLAELATQIEQLEAVLRRLEGRIEVVEHRTQEALDEARAARADAASTASAPTGTGAPANAPSADPAEDGASADEVSAYRGAYAAWRAGDADACVDRFREFLQTYPSSAYADDSAYWLADCYFKQGDYKTAVLRFDDVVSNYPTGNKAADALYRQGEALLRLGPGYGKAAGKAFERVIEEYPDSNRVGEARRQLELLRSG